MEDRKRTIRIDSILGGHSPLEYFAGADQFQDSLAIDPSLNSDDIDNSGPASGLLRPTYAKTISGTQLQAAPLWQVANPKQGSVFVYAYNGSVYAHGYSPLQFAEVGDLTDGGSAKGNGAEYYDNYVYFSRDTTIARFGPLNGSPAFTDDYWVSTLSKTALGNPTYPIDDWTAISYPSHIMHRHSDGRLYILDVVDNKGTIHFIQTTKTSVEGDTDNGSTYNKLQVGYGLWPSAIASYGTGLAIAFFEYEETTGSSNPEQRAKIAFWDTTSQNVNHITWVEFPDSLVSAIRNVNGTLYLFSGAGINYGTRVTRYVGGSTFEEVGYFEALRTPFPDAVDGEASRLMFGTFGGYNITDGYSVSGVYSIGLQKGSLGRGFFMTGQVSSLLANPMVTSIIREEWDSSLALNQPYIGWSNGGSGSTRNNIDEPYARGDGNKSIWWSQRYRIGQPFKITKIRIPLAMAISSGMSVIPRIYFDSDRTLSGTQTTSAGTVLTTIDNTNYPSAKSVTLRPENAVGKHSFFLELDWDGTALLTVGLPITIEYELLDD